MIEYRPTPDHDWMPFSGDTLDDASLRMVNAVCGYEKYRLVDNDCPFTFAHTRHWCGYEGCRDS